MPNKTMAFYEKRIRSVCPPEETAVLWDEIRRTYDTLCREHAGDKRAVRQHTHGMIYPAVSTYRVLQAHGRTQGEAYRFVYDTCAAQAEKKAEAMRQGLRIPGMVYLMPFLWQIVTRTTFGQAAGFRWHFYKVGGRRVKFDMLACPFCRICEELGCRELVPAFCHTDDVSNGHLHPQLYWHRTKTLGGGDALCDFDLTVLPKNSPRP